MQCQVAWQCGNDANTGMTNSEERGTANKSGVFIHKLAAQKAMVFRFMSRGLAIQCYL